MAWVGFALICFGLGLVRLGFALGLLWLAVGLHGCLHAYLHACLSVCFPTRRSIDKVCEHVRSKPHARTIKNNQKRADPLCDVLFRSAVEPPPHQPVTSRSQPVTSRSQPVTSRFQPVTSGSQPVTSGPTSGFHWLGSGLPLVVLVGGWFTLAGEWFHLQTTPQPVANHSLREWFQR